MEMEEAFLFDKSLVICQNKGKTELFGAEDEYSFWIRFPMNTLKVLLIICLTTGLAYNFFSIWMQDAIFKIPILNSCQVEDPDPESQYFVVSAPASSCQESFNSEAVCSSDTTVLTLEAKTDNVKTIWLREIRKKTEQRSRLETSLTTGRFKKMF